MSEETFRLVITVGVGIAALCIFVMAGAAVALALVASKLKQKVDGVMVKVEPIIDTVRRVVQQNESKVSDIADRAKEIAASARDVAANAKIISGQAKDIGEVAKDQAHIFAEVGRDIADRAKAQVARVDSAVDETVDQAKYAGHNVREAMMKPVREVNGLFAGLKAAVGAMGRGRMERVDHVTQNEEMFI